MIVLQIQRIHICGIIMSVVSFKAVSTPRYQLTSLLALHIVTEEKFGREGAFVWSFSHLIIKSCWLLSFPSIHSPDGDDIVEIRF